MTNTFSELSKEDLNKFRIELKIDPGKSFDSEFVRATNLENKLANKYGFDGVKLIFEDRNSANYHLLGNIPEASPWSYLNSLDMSGVIDTIFEPIKNKVPKLISAMKKRVRLIYVEKKDITWKLHYLLDMRLYDNRNYYRIYTGGLPNPNAIRNKNLIEFDWSIPLDLQEFYSIHDGFTFVLSSEQIKVMAEIMNPIIEEQKISPEGYNFDDLLEFFPDGAGNAQCFIRIEEKNNSTVDWDHETWEISEPIGFYEFIDERMSELDEE